MKLAFSIAEIGKNLRLRDEVEALMKKKSIPFTWFTREKEEEKSITDYYVNDEDFDKAEKCIRLAKQKMIVR